MRIGIVTFCDTQDNYGQVLQAYALQQFLIRIGQEPFHIKQDWRSSLPKSFIKKVINGLLTGKSLSILKNKAAQILSRRSKASPIINDRKFDTFRKTKMKWTDKYYSYSELVKNPPMAEAYIAGSDQIWRIISPVFFLQFGPPTSLRIAYAASFGGLYETNKIIKRKYIKYLQNFNAISCREKQGADYCRALGFENVTVVPDPTLLLSGETYRKITVKPDKKSYILLYLLGNPINLSLSEIYSWAAEKNKTIIYVASQGRNDTYPKEFPTIEEWLGLIDGADAIITNSFHGTVFCILFNRPFIVLPLAGKVHNMNDRIQSLLLHFNLSERLYNCSLDPIFNPIDYTPINRKLINDREKVVNYFSVWLDL